MKLLSLLKSKFQRNTSELDQMILNKMKFKQQVFKNYKDITSGPDFISYDVLSNQFFIDNNISKSNPLWNKVTVQRDKNFADKNQILFPRFVITFTMNTRFSTTDLIPTIKLNNDPNIQTFSFVKSEDPRIEKMLTAFNALVEKLLMTQEKPVEIMPGIVISFDKLNRLFKLYFSDKLLNNTTDGSK
ncbi:DUF2714 domain-containing protein [Mycoplasma sp. Pen4]|uniref:MSC_0623 family F1-like ATPase-associated protein n=1 Tax=Mycoplasma sp. Pen4 TaxID=640330 RepID=UPI001654AACB|nr:DUF2714 domain-containing protein [Mycoplasma sp. Pen4]QNM93343.1 DUF2714 domain-containing protein [Mycoplasma sp. Pen4]